MNVYDSDHPITAIYRCDAQYPALPPWEPEERYPEYPFHTPPGVGPNPAYRAVRGALQLLGLDAAHCGTRDWNPLGGIVRPGDTVVLKPNFIRDFHDSRGDDITAVITHGSMIRAVLDYVAIALAGRGRVVIADAPQCEASFERICAFAGLDAIRSIYRERSSLTLDLLDLRPEFTEKVEGVIVGHKPLAGDPAGYVVVNLGARSEFVSINHMNRRLYGSEYDRCEVAAHHHDDVHEYLISKTVLSADVFINLPKLKTHKKVGLTVNLKNLVGINGNKNWLPHHREGVPATGGDQYAASGMRERIEFLLLRAFKSGFPKLGGLRRFVGRTAYRAGQRIFGSTARRIRSGNWWGNDTTWRMVLDLNRALRYGDMDGSLREVPRVQYFCFVDGIVAGEGNGPTDPDPHPAGVVLAGRDPLAVDLVCARLMGFDWRRIALLRQAMLPHPLDVSCKSHDELVCRSNVPAYDRPLGTIQGPCLAFRPHFGWVGHVELDAAARQRPNGLAAARAHG